MQPDDLGVPGREILLGGGLAQGRRAGLLLFAIEARTAHLVSKSREATATYLTPSAIDEREQAFLRAIAQGRDLPLQPTIQDLERYAPDWASLASGADARLRAGVARALGRKYTFTKAAIAGVRENLGLDTASVQGEFLRLYGEPLTSVYAPQVGLGDRVRWAVSRAAAALEGLPPFWVAFIITLPLGGGQLALPIAVAGIGAIPGIAICIVFGLVNALTVAALAESVARSGTTRFGVGFLGQLASEYLGRSASVLYTAISLLDLLLFLLVFYLGIAGTFADATQVRSEVWLAVVFAICLFFLSRRSLNSTIASSVVITGTNLVLFTLIPLIALPRLRIENLTFSQIPCIGGRLCDPTVLQMIFGIMLATFFSHGIVANYGRAILRRDPGGRSWVLGCVAAIGVTTVVSCLWILAVNGAVAPEALANETGTAITAIAKQVGPVISWLGTLAVVLSMGLGCIHMSLGLLFTVGQWLPQASTQTGKVVRQIVSMSPVVLVFVAAEWITISGAGSFSGLLAVFGAIAMPLLSGVFPVLLLAATRLKGDFALPLGPVLRFFGNRVLLAVLCLFFVGSVLAYGLFVWDGLIERVATLIVGIALIVIILIVLSKGALRKRVVVQVREDRSRADGDALTVVSGGELLAARTVLAYEGSEDQALTAGAMIAGYGNLRSAVIDLPRTGAKLLKVWVHRITPEWGSEGLPARVRLEIGDGAEEMELKPPGGQVAVDFDGAPSRVEIVPLESEGGPA